MGLHLRDSMNLLGKVTPRKAWNASKVLSSYYWSKWRKKPNQWGRPISLSFEPTTACNLGCPECPSGLRQFSRPTGNLNEDFFKETIDQLSKDLLYLTFYFQGEPFIHPRFLNMVKHANEKGIYTATSTNAHFLDDETARKTVESGLDRLIISIDGTTQEVYEQYRVNGSLEKVKEGVGNMVKWKNRLKSKTPHLIFQFLVVRPNEHQVEEVKQLSKEMGIDEVRFKTAQVYDYEQGNPLIPINEKYARYYKNGDGSWHIKNNMDNHCWRLWHSCVITWDGQVVPCCFDKDASHSLGDLKMEGFDGIWQSEPYKRFRSAVIKSRKEVDICSNCTEGTKVWT